MAIFIVKLSLGITGWALIMAGGLVMSLAFSANARAKKRITEGPLLWLGIATLLLSLYIQ